MDRIKIFPGHVHEMQKEVDEWIKEMQGKDGFEIISISLTQPPAHSGGMAVAYRVD